MRLRAGVPLLFLLAVLCVLLGGVGAAGAQELTPRNRERARPFFDAADQAMGRGDLAEGQRLLEEAYQIYPDERFQLSLGGVYERRGAREAALRAYQRYLDRVPAAVRGVKRTQVALEAVRRLTPPPAPVPEPRPAKLVVPAPPPPRPLPLAPPPGRRPLRAVGFTLVGLGIAGLAAGAALVALHGYQDCAEAPNCDFELSSRTPGVLLLVGGGLVAGTGGLLLGVDYRRQRGAHHAALSLSGRF